MVTTSNIGNSFLIDSFFTLIGATQQAIPITRIILIIQLPITLASAISPAPLATLLNDIASSGAQVPNAPIVSAIIILDILK